ncbi:MAG TPA: DUF4261 domain-containing protein, partial [Propionibacteriaceae bacterium]|nr:DUF4261 domain-containing protein [Propionibacteriaceae bacterium]
MSSGPQRENATPLVVELWYAEAPELDDPATLQVLRSRWPTAELQLESIIVPHDDAPSPLLTVIMTASPVGQDGKALPDVSQTWDWEDAEAAVLASRCSLLVTEMFGAGRTPQERWDAMSGVVAEMVRVTRPKVLSWPQSQRVGEPAQFVPGDLDGLINVRYFSISNDPGAVVMDTLGLHVFGLPDVQCHFRAREPSEIAVMLFSTAGYLFRVGDVIADGNTISGPQGDERLVCFHERALLAPSRQVIDVDLGDPYAA